MSEKKEQPNLMAVLSYIGLLFLIPLLVNKDDAFCQFHAKQGLVLFICEAATAIFAFIPIVGWFGAPLLYIFWVVLSVIGIVNVAAGNRKELPLIGAFADKFKI